MGRRFAFVLVLWMAAPACPAADAPTRSLDPRMDVGVFAESPAIVTPTGIDVDHRGRVWAIESNTHFRPPDYAGHASDRVLIFADLDRDGRAEQIETFADGFVHAMSLSVRPDGSVYLATRKDVLRLVPSEKKGQPPARQAILRLDTPGDYPHNGLAGLSFDGLGYLYIGLGENLGAAYRLIGTDGRVLAGGGEGGSIFRCRPDGTDLTLWATGFWNPHASCVDAFGRMFAVDNDPDSRPPCRLLHIVPGGDYGYRFRNGRKGIHPFTAWDGELPGTLPMVAGTGEAPSGIVAYESDALPDAYRGNLFATSWGDHRIDRFRIRQRGMGLVSQSEPIVVGGENFRPVGLALAPDGCLFATDWVLKDYKVHGKGRIWRIAPKGAPRTAEDVADVPKHKEDELRSRLDSPRMDIRRAAARALAARKIDVLRGIAADESAPRRARIEAAWAAAVQANAAAHSSPARSGLDNPELHALWPDFDHVETVATLQALAPRLTGPTDNPPRLLVRLVECVGRQLPADVASLGPIVDGGDPFVFAAVVQALGDRLSEDSAIELLRPERITSPRMRLAVLLAVRHRVRAAAPAEVLAMALRDPDWNVRRAAVQWIGEEGLQTFRGDVANQLSSPSATSDLFEAALASLEMLDGLKRASRDEISGADYAMRLVRHGKVSPAVRARALRMVPPRHKGIDAALLKRFVSSANAELRYQALRTLRETALPEAPAMLRAIAADASADTALRCEAVIGVAAALQSESPDPAASALLCRLAAGDDRRLRIEALRALRRSARLPEVRRALDALAAGLRKSSAATAETRELADQLAIAYRASGLPVPKEVESIAAPAAIGLDERARQAMFGGDAAVGQRIFDHPNAGGCFRCHTVDGRGGHIGPDLSTIARTSNREKLIQSILQPSKEIAPQFTTWTFVTRSGRPIVGMIVSEDREGRIRVGTEQGEIAEIDVHDIEQRQPQPTSVMPERLVESMTPAEFRDLVAYLTTLR